MPSIMPVSPRFGDSNGDPSVSPNDNPTKYLSPVSIVNPSSKPSETSKQILHV